MVLVTMEKALVPPADGGLKTRLLGRIAHGPVLHRGGGLTLARPILLQNHCIDGVRGGWSWCESC